MPEEKDKKISFKILTAEDLLEDKEIPPQEIIPFKKQELKTEIVEDVKTQPEIKKTELKPPEELKGGKVEFEISEALKGVLSFPKTTTQKPETEISVSYPESPKEEIYLPQKQKEEPEIFYRSRQEKPLFIPQTQQEEKLITKKPFSFLRYLFLFLIPALIVGVVFVFKPYQKLLALLPKKEPKGIIEETPQPQIPVSPPQPLIIFPSPQSQETQPMTTSQKILTIPETTITQPQITQELPFVNYFLQKSIQISKLDFNELKTAIDSLLVKQEYPGSLFYIKLVYNNQILPFDFIFNYFVRPTKITQEKINKFKQELTGNYAFMLYYGYTRKYPIIIFEIKNPQVVKEFNLGWEKLNMVNDIKSLFLGIEPGKPLNNQFINKEIKGNSYRVIYFENNLRFLWGIVDNYLIYSTTETGFEKILFLIKP